MLKIYIAGKFECKLMINAFGELLQLKTNIELTNTWSKKIDKMTINECAREDYHDIERADVLIAIAPFANGANSEMGYALGLGKKVFYVVDRIFHSGTINPAWGEAIPLPAGYLSHPYVEYEFCKYQVNFSDRGWIVHNVNDIITILEILNNIDTMKQ